MGASNPNGDSTISNLPAASTLTGTENFVLDQGESTVKITAANLGKQLFNANNPVPVAGGGTGQITLTAHAVLVGEGTNAVAQVAPGASGIPLVSQGASADPAFGTATVPGGGTGLTTIPAHAVMIGEGTSNVATVAPGSAGVPLVSQGASADPAFSTATVPGGGTGATTLTAHGVLIGEGTNPIVATAVGTTGQVLVGSTGADPAFGTTVAGLTFTSALTPQSTGGIVGTTTNDNANAGSIGEYVSNTTTSVSLSSGTATNITSISLTAGDWDVSGVFQTSPAGGTTISTHIEGISTTSGTLGALGTFNTDTYSPSTGNGETHGTPTVRVSIASTTTVYLIGQVTFSGGTCSSNGFIRARRVR
jgi:hypothetical protein